MEHEASQKHGMETHLIGSSCKNLLWLELIMGGPQVSATIDKVEAFLKSEFMSLTKLKKKSCKSQHVSGGNHHMQFHREGLYLKTYMFFSLHETYCHEVLKFPSDS